MRKDFVYGDLVWVKAPGYKPFIGRVYSQYRLHSRRSERIICVETPSGSGVGFRIRHVLLHKKVTNV